MINRWYPDELYHASFAVKKGEKAHKYVRKVMRDGKWRYFYPQVKGKMNHISRTMNKAKEDRDLDIAVTRKRVRSNGRRGKNMVRFRIGEAMDKLSSKVEYARLKNSIKPQHVEKRVKSAKERASRNPKLVRGKKGRFA